VESLLMYNQPFPETKTQLVGNCVLTIRLNTSLLFYVLKSKEEKK